MFIFYFIVDTFLEAVSVRWLFTVFLFAKNHRTAVTKPSIKHCTRYGWPGPGASLSPMSGAEKSNQYEFTVLKFIDKRSTTRTIVKPIHDIVHF